MNYWKRNNKCLPLKFVFVVLFQFSHFLQNPMINTKISVILRSLRIQYIKQWYEKAISV